MRKSIKLYQIPLQLLWSVLLTITTGFLGAAPLKSLRNGVHPVLYFGLLLVGAVPLYYLGKDVPMLRLLAALYVAQGLIIGLYSEMEEHGAKISTSASVALGATGGLTIIGVLAWIQMRGLAWVDRLRADIQTAAQAFISQRPELTKVVQVQDVLDLFPAGVAMLTIAALATALIFEKPFSAWAGVQMKRKEKLADFSAPDTFIWFLIVSILFGYVQTGWPLTTMLGKNMFYIAGTVYFFQGLAVLANSFEVFKIGLFSRLVFLFIFVFQFPPLLSLVGVVDYWVDFRRMFKKRLANVKKQV